MSPKSPKMLQKYQKQFPSLIFKDNIVYQFFNDDQGRDQHKQICVPKSLWCGVIYRLHNSPTAGHIKRLKNLENDFPNFSEYVTSTIQNCLHCLQLKPVSTEILKTPMQLFSSLKSYPGEMLHVDFVDSLESPQYRYVLTCIDVLTKYLFAVPLSNGSSETVARELASIFFCHSYLRKTIL